MLDLPSILLPVVECFQANGASRLDARRLTMLAWHASLLCYRESETREVYFLRAVQTVQAAYLNGAELELLISELRREARKSIALALHHDMITEADGETALAAIELLAERPLAAQEVASI